MRREVAGVRARSVAFGIGLALCLVAVGVGLVLGVQRSNAYSQSTVVPVASMAMEKTPSAESTLAATPTAVSRVTVLTTTVSSGALLISFQVRQMPGDYLFEVPVLAVGQRRLEPSPASLEAAKFALLKVVTAGSAEASLSFADVPSGEIKGKLIFNPNGEAESRVNPKIEVPVSWLPEAAATPKP